MHTVAVGHLSINRIIIIIIICCDATIRRFTSTISDRSIAYHRRRPIALVQFFCGFFVVRFNVERAEHVREQTGVHGQQATNRFREITSRLELNLNRMNENYQELYL